ncbi:MAG: 50S ribosomal protein L6 [Planctomycetota bacterium]
MSRIGKNPVPIPDGVSVSVSGQTVAAEGPKGQARLDVHHQIAVRHDEENHQVVLKPEALKQTRAKAARYQRAQWGTARTLVANLLEGVARGYRKTVQVVGVGYGAEVRGRELVLSVGFANDISLDIPEGIEVPPPKSENLQVSGVGSLPCSTVTFEGVDKQLVGQFAAQVRAVRPPEPYKGKGIRYEGEDVKRKAGKALAAGAPA